MEKENAMHPVGQNSLMIPSSYEDLFWARCCARCY